MNRPVVLSSAVAALVAAAVLTWIDVRQEREFRRLIAVGDAALAHDQAFMAIEAFSGAIALKGDSMLAHLKRGDAYLRRQELTPALRDLRQAAALDPTAPKPLELLGDVNTALGRYERASEDYRHYIAIDDRAPRVLYKLALAYYRNAQPSLAIESLRKAIAINEPFTEAHYLLGMCLRQQGHQEQARKAFVRAVTLNPTFAPAREELAELYATVGRRRDGVGQLEALAALEPAGPGRLVTVGLTFARLGREDAAILALGRAAELHPDSEVVHAALGQVWLESAQRGDASALDKALSSLHLATARADASSDALALYGRALMLAGQTEAAEHTLRQATTRLPVERAAFRDLSTTAQRLGHRDLALTALSQYAALLETDQERQTVAAEMDTIAAADVPSRARAASLDRAHP